MDTNKSKQNFTAWAVVAIIGLLGLNAYQWFNNSQLKTQTSTQQEEMVELEKVQAELDQDYQVALESLEELRGDNKELNDLIDSQKKELTEKKDQINNLIWTKRELGKAKEELAALNISVTGYIEQLNQLKAENEGLLTENTTLHTTNMTLVENLEVERKDKEEILQARAILASEKEELSSTNEMLSYKVDMANAIKLNSMDIKGFEIEKNGKLDGKKKAKNIDLMRFCFTTETNLVTPKGEKIFYVRVVNPQGETLGSDEAGAGIITNKLDNTQVRYSASGAIEYNNEETNACLDWTLAEPLPKGEYNIEMYNNGFKVGTGVFKLK